MPKNLHDSKRNRPSAITSIKTNKHKVMVQKHIKEHKHVYQDASTKTHDHHSHLKRRVAPFHVTFHDKMMELERQEHGRCYTHEDMRKKKMIGGKKKKRGYSRSGFKFLHLALAHPQGLHDALSKLARESNVDVRIYVHG